MSQMSLRNCFLRSINTLTDSYTIRNFTSRCASSSPFMPQERTWYYYYSLCEKLNERKLMALSIWYLAQELAQSLLEQVSKPHLSLECWAWVPATCCANYIA